jgi:hypothetical protein
MKNHNKLLLASELLVESAKIYHSATSDTDFAKAILLAGAVTGIIEPLLLESGTVPSQIQLAKLAVAIDGVEFDDLCKKDQKREIGNFLFYSKFAYNSLKHAGKKDTTAVDDVSFVADLKAEARDIINFAINDFGQIPRQYVTNAALSTDFMKFLHTPIS